MKITSLWLHNLFWKLFKHEVKMRPDHPQPIIEIDGIRYHKDCLCCKWFKHTKEEHQHELEKRHDRLHDQLGRRLKQLEKDYGPVGFGFIVHEYDEKFLELRKKFSKTIQQIKEYYEQHKE